MLTDVTFIPEVAWWRYIRSQSGLKFTLVAFVSQLMLSFFRTDRQPQDLAFCLALLNFSEKGLRKLQENFACYADKVSDPEVFASFTSILGKLRNSPSPRQR